MVYKSCIVYQSPFGNLKFVYDGLGLWPVVVFYRDQNIELKVEDVFEGGGCG